MTEPTRYYRTPMGIVHGHDPKCCASTNPAPCTPVVVLDPSDDAAVERLADTLAEDYPGNDRAFARHILTALLPPEPVTEPGGGAWAVVKDCNGDAWVRGEDRLWRYGESYGGWTELVRNYGPLTVVREGIGGDA